MKVRPLLYIIIEIGFGDDVGKVEDGIVISGILIVYQDGLVRLFFN
jgi:hypothetical protein